MGRVAAKSAVGNRQRTVVINAAALAGDVAANSRVSNGQQCCIAEDATAEAGTAAADSAIDNGRCRSIADEDASTKIALGVPDC